MRDIEQLLAELDPDEVCEFAEDYCDYRGHNPTAVVREWAESHFEVLQSYAL